MANCIVCDGNSSRLRNFAKRGEESLDIFRCADCNCEFLWPQPSNDWLKEEYAQYYTRRTDETKGIKTPYFKKLLSSLGVDFSNKRVIEFGSGEGDCLLALRELWNDVELTAVEGNNESEALLKSIDCDFFNTDIENWIEQNQDMSGEEQKFDYILMFDLIEHLRNPVDVINKLAKNHLKKGGAMIATFPCAESTSHGILRRFWPQYKVEHLSYFTEKAVLNIEQRSGLSRKQLTRLTKSLPLKYLMKVGSNFGPKKTQKITRFVERAIPSVILKQSCPIPLGESLWVAENL